ncbi:MAG: thiamine-phosphate kinase [Phycisphaerales bacterium]|nr:thiamine-phosphate kinase [Phycisphaerales bacterium]
MNESQLHNHIYHRSADLAISGGNQLIVGPGDDCAVYQTPSGELTLITVDQLVEGRHFESSTSIDLIARKAIARSVSDIAAMGGTPSWSLGTGVLPKDYAHANELFDAMHKWALHWGCPLIGGDIASHASIDHPLTITVTVGGTMAPNTQPVLRSGAKPGDELYLTGQVGGSFASGWHLLFEPRLQVGQWASANNVHAMMDLSDGLGRDADRIAKASGLIIEIDATKLPISHHITRANKDWRDAVSEGEDYELLMCIDPTTTIPSTTTPSMTPPMQGPIGTCRACAPNESPGAIIIDPHGEHHHASSMGWDH